MTYGCKRKTITKVLKKKITMWLESIEDKELRASLKNEVIVTGGSITSMLMGDEIKDFDIYLKSQKAVEAVAQYYCGVFIKQNPKSCTPTVRVTEGRVEIHVGSAGVAESEDAGNTPEEEYENNLLEGTADKVQYHERAAAEYMPPAEDRPKYRPIFLSANAITLSDKVQIVIRFYGQPDEIHANYDYEHCKNVYDYGTDTVNLLPSAMEAILSKTLLYTGSLYPICSLFRMRKFLDRGWRIGAGEIVKMSFQISKLDLTNLDVLKEQLTGCDQAYMRNLIYGLEEAYKDNPDFQIDNTYMMKLIDKIFN